MIASPRTASWVCSRGPIARSPTHHYAASLGWNPRPSRSSQLISCVTCRSNAKNAPCIVITGNGQDVEAVAAMVNAVHRAVATMCCHVVAILPNNSSNETMEQVNAAEHCTARYTYDVPLTLVHRPDLGTQFGFLLEGGDAPPTPGDCILCAVDQKAGILRHLNLSPVLTVIGIQRAPSLGPDLLPPSPHSSLPIDSARASSILGVPAVCINLASPSPDESLSAAIQVTEVVIPHILGCIKATNRRWPAPLNFPRAHFPFPTRGRWSLGRDVPMPPQLWSDSRLTSPDPMEAAVARDNWAMGSESDWAAGLSCSDNKVNRPPADWTLREAKRVLREAFCEGDLFLCINVPGSWSSNDQVENRFEPTRPGVLWHCQYVEPQYGSTSRSFTDETSWSMNNTDVFGRSIPKLKAGQKNEAGGFVSQDNTSSVPSNVINTITSAAAPADHITITELPKSFVIKRGTVLNDGVMCGDVEAVFKGKASITALQTWPSGHPFCLSDALLAYTLVQGTDGLPEWLI